MLLFLAGDQSGVLRRDHPPANHTLTFTVATLRWLRSHRASARLNCRLPVCPVLQIHVTAVMQNERYFGALFENNWHHALGR